MMEGILKRIGQEDMVLVTITAQAGSTPRGVGTQMLVGRAGRLAGTIGGGAIEAQAIRQAVEQINVKKSLRYTYALDGVSSTSLDMVCGGGVEVLFSYISQNDAHWQSVARQSLNGLIEHIPGALILSESVPPEFSAEASEVPFGGRVEQECFVLPLPLRQRIILFGGGHVAQSLVPVLSAVDFRVIVVENRPEFADAALFPDAEQVILGDYEAISQSLTLRDDDFYIIMTHGHRWDFVLQEQLLRRKFAYIGVMGSRRKIASVNARLLEAGISQERMDKVHTPIGLPIQAVTPAEIAISVTAECIAVRAEGKRGTAGSCPSYL